jgi:hypothetical protein
MVTRLIVPLTPSASAHLTALKARVLALRAHNAALRSALIAWHATRETRERDAAMLLASIPAPRMNVEEL